ncbi:MAG: beta-aspartyl-peptidase [Clostridia bacterium]|nr:beta-aspartyl-peptidase [Clostridia bacterium]
MFTLIRGASVYTPDYIGQKDVLIAFDRIAGIGDFDDRQFPVELEVINAQGKLLMPGFIDQHVHIAGGGGEGGFSTRTHEIHVCDLVENGITTVIGVLGTDGVTRSLEELYAKAKALEEEGVTAYIYSGSYQIPVKTFTGSIQRDIVLIDKVLGVGEIALSDHRSFQPTVDELARIASEARNGGLISGKPGVVHLHLGNDSKGLELVFKLAEGTPIPIRQFVPSHVNRKGSLFNQAIRFAHMGGFIDLTAGMEPKNSFDDCVPVYIALKQLLDCGVDDGSITVSSDGNGSIPVFDSDGVLVSIEAGSCKVLLDDMRKAVFEYGVPLDKALKTVTVNPAKMLRLDAFKGAISVGKHADIVLTDSDLNIEKVFAKGKEMVDSGKYYGKNSIR